MRSAITNQLGGKKFKTRKKNIFWFFFACPSTIVSAEHSERRAAIVWKKWRRMLGKRLKKREGKARGKKKKKKRSSEKKSKVKEATTWLYGKRAASCDRKKILRKEPARRGKRKMRNEGDQKLFSFNLVVRSRRLRLRRLVRCEP